MLKMTENDKMLVEKFYKDFLNNLKFLMKEYNVSNPLQCYEIINMQLRNGNFSQTGKILFDSDFNYLQLSNVDSEGIYMMYGVCCCRHASNLVNDIFQVLGFDSSLLYINIDKDGNWHKLENAASSNHVVVLLIYDSHKYILDPRNNFQFEIQSDLSLSLLEHDNYLSKQNFFLAYHDSNVNDIGKVLTKYYNLREFGIENVYD